jgi:hypothetical protein
MTTGSSTHGIWQTELASPESSGITVRLLWHRSTNRLTVAVADAANDDFFEPLLDATERVRGRRLEPQVLPRAA